MRGAYGTATVLFTDLVGSTDLLSRLGEAAFDELRRAHFAALREAIGWAGGEEVKNTGDGIMATFASVADAVRCAVAMQQATHRHSSRAGAVPVAIRVGLSIGDVTFEDGDVFGAPVVEAARLVAAAAAGGILTTQVARALARRADAKFADVGALELKGLPDAVPVCQVLWEPLAEPSVPLPALLTDIGRIFVGRDAELERLAQLWKEAAAGQRRLALFGGEPGVGKTRLAAEVATRVLAEGGIVLAGRCDEDLGVPYQPFVEALRHFVDHTPPAELRDALGRFGGELVRLVPDLTEQVPDLLPPLHSDPETERYRLFDAAAAWLAAVSARMPLLIVLDDLHWAAKPTLLLLRHVLRFSEPLRLLIVGTYRDTELGRRHPLAELLADLRRQTGVERIAISGLDAAAVASFVEQVAGHVLEGEDEQFARAIYAETEGNPFFIGEVLRHLAETGAVERRHGRWVATTAIEELGIPEGIRDVVGRRLSRLSDDANNVLALAAVIGADFEPVLVERAGDVPEEMVVAALDEAVAARVVSEIPGSATRYRFAHALVRGTLYEELTAARRVALHRKVAEAIEKVHAGRLDDHLPALAYHYTQAAVPAAEPAKAVDYARRAGDAALAQLAHDDAVRYYRQALDLLGLSEGPIDNAQRTELLITLGEAQRRAGDPAYRETLFEAARRAREDHHSDALARAALANCRGSLMSDAGRTDTQRLDVLRAALEAAGASDSTTRARLTAHIAMELVWTGDRYELARLSDDAVAMARRLGDPATLADVLLSSFYAIYAPSTVSQRLETTAELLALVERLGDQRIAVHAYWHRARAAMEVADVSEARRCAELQERIAAELGEPTLRWMAAATAAGLPLAAGQLQEAEDRTVAALAMGKDVQPDAETFFAAQIFPIRHEQGRLEEVLPIYRGMAADPEFPIAAADAVTALIYCELERPEDSRPYYEPLAATRFTRMRIDNLWLLGLAGCAEVCVRLGDPASAAVLSDLLSPYADHIVTVATSGLNCVSHYLGLLATDLGRFNQAEHRFSAAAATQMRIGALSWLARTRLEWARMLLARRQSGDAGRARELLDQALATARELGLANVERRAVALLQDCR